MLSAMSSCLISGCSETSTRSNGGKVVLVSSSLLGIPVYCALVVSVARLISITIRLLIILSIQASTSFQSNSNHPSIQKVSATRADFKQTSSSNIIFISVCKASFDYSIYSRPLILKYELCTTVPFFHQDYTLLKLLLSILMLKQVGLKVLMLKSWAFKRPKYQVC